MNAFAKTLTNISKAATWVTGTLIRGRYELWIRKHGRTYADAAEKEQRFTIFKEKLQWIRKHNALKTYGCTLGLNEYADMLAGEIENTYCRKGFMNYLTGEDLEMIHNAGREMPTPKAVAKGAWRTKGRSQGGKPPKGARREAKRRLCELRDAASNVKMS